MRVAEGAMREGLLYDLVGRFTDEDARVRSVRAMEQRYHVDALQADRVEATAVQLLEQVESDGGSRIRSPNRRCAGRRGCTRSGSTSPTRNITATAPICSSTPTCRAFRARSSCCSRRWSAATAASCRSSALEDLVPPWDRHAEFLIVLLRLAVLLHRGRSPQPLPEVRLQVKGRNLDAANCRRAG